MAEYADAFYGAVGAVADRDRELERLLIESSTLAFRVAYAVLRHREDAEDVAQEALIRAHRHFERLRQRDKFRSWLVRVSWRLALDRQRTNRRRTRRDTEYGRDAGENRCADPLAASEIWRALDALPRKLRLTMILANIHGHELRVVAQLLGVPEGTVKSRLFKARERIREMLQ